VVVGVVAEAEEKERDATRDGGDGRRREMARDNGERLE